MRRITTLLTLVCLIAAGLGTVRASADPLDCAGAATAAFSPFTGLTTLANGCVKRVWEPRSVGLATRELRDARTGFTVERFRDFSLVIDGLTIGSDELGSMDLSVESDGEQASATFTLSYNRVLTIVRTVTVYAGIAGFKATTRLEPIAPLALSGYRLDEVPVGPAAAATLHEFRAGADWREPDWSPPGIGPNHAGDWHEAKTSAAGQPVSGTAEWISVALPGGPTVGIVNERRDYASSVGSYDGQTVSAGVDLSRDIVYLGPFEESGHIENPGEGPARHRALQPLRPLDLEPSFLILGADADDEAWQFSKYLTGHRLEPYPKRVIFNSDKVDSDQISTGAKDDMNYDRFMQILPEVREMGVDTFVFDDGWMARSGDWCPDSPACTEPRWDGDPASKFRPRFPDDEFAAVREALAGGPGPEDDIDLGLWMNPLAFHPSSKAFQTNPQWSCAPVGTGTGVVTAADPDSGSNEAGIGLWNPRALGVHPDDGVTPIRMIDYLEERILRAIEFYGAKYFKFDFLVWVDCAGAEPVTMYEYHDEFVDMLDRLQAAHPEVTYQVDDTNDHRMFPFETIARGPSWYLNGGPSVSHTLHTAWTLAPFVPGSALGMRSLGGERNSLGVDKVMAAAINTHLTFSFPVDNELNASQRAQVKMWAEFYNANSATMAAFTYPLLDDPASLGWTALQPWDGDTHSGWLLAYRQSSPDAAKAIALKGLGRLPADAPFTVTRVDPASGLTTDLGTFTAGELRTSGLPADATLNGYAFYRVTPA